LNQFVAIFNEGYSAAEKAGFTTFLQERAKVCHSYRTRFPPPDALLRLPRGLVLLSIAMWDMSNLGVLALKRYFPVAGPVAAWLQPWASFDLLVPVIVFLLTWRIDYEIGELGACGDPDQVLVQLLQLLQHPHDEANLLSEGNSVSPRRDESRRILHRQGTPALMSKSTSEATTPGGAGPGRQLSERVTKQPSMLRSTSNLSSVTSFSDKTDKTDKNVELAQNPSGHLDVPQQWSTASLLAAGLALWVALAAGLIAGVDSNVIVGQMPQFAKAWACLIIVVHTTLLILGGTGSWCLFWHVGLPLLIATLDLLPRFIRAFFLQKAMGNENKMVLPGRAITQMGYIFHRIAMLSHASLPSASMESKKAGEEHAEAADSRKKPHYLWVCYRSDYNTLQLGEESAREQAQREERRLLERRIEGMMGQVMSLSEDMAAHRDLLEQLSHQVAELSTSHEDIPDMPSLSRAPSVAITRAATAGP